MRGDGPDDSADVERQEGMTDQLSLFGGEAVVRPLGGGEAGSGSAPTGERQAAAASEGNRALVTDTLMERICELENLNRAYKRVKANRGSPGVDRMTVGELGAWLVGNAGDGAATTDPPAIGATGTLADPMIRAIAVNKSGVGLVLSTEVTIDTTKPDS